MLMAFLTLPGNYVECNRATGDAYAPARGKIDIAMPVSSPSGVSCLCVLSCWQVLWQPFGRQFVAVLITHIKYVRNMCTSK